MGFIVTCQGLAAEGDTATTGEVALGHPALFTRGSHGGTRPHWRQLHLSASASAPSPPLHTQSLAHFSHSAGQHEQQLFLQEVHVHPSHLQEPSQVQEPPVGQGQVSGSMSRGAAAGGGELASPGNWTH